MKQQYRCGEGDTISTARWIDTENRFTPCCVATAVWSRRRRFFRETVAAEGASWPTKINLDGNAATHRALRMLGDEDSRWQSVEIRARRYLNNIVEQDHRAIKRRCVSMLGLKSYRSAAITFAGIELAHRIRKGQFSTLVEVQGRTSTLKDLWDRALDCSSGLAGQSGGQIPSMHQIWRTGGVDRDGGIPARGFPACALVSDPSDRGVTCHRVAQQTALSVRGGA
jgi:DDE domain